MRKVVKVGIDFGTSYSFIGFKNGDYVMPLIPSREHYGIPTVFYYDGKQKAVGRRAVQMAESRPEYAVYSIKRKLKTPSFMLGGGTSFTSEDIVYEILASIVAGAEDLLSTNYLIEYDEMEAVITVPVDFTEPMKNLILNAARRIHLKNGSSLRVTRVIPEPIAAAIEYFGIKEEEDVNIVVFDLGGGTFDAAIVRANADGDGMPYEILEQEGDRELGGDDWDRAIVPRVKQEYINQVGGNITPNMEQAFIQIAREVKEELTMDNFVSHPAVIKGQPFDVNLSIEEFEEMTSDLLERALEKVRALAAKRSDLRIDYIILTGGSSYMPQIKNALEKERIFGPNTKVRLVEPERAIAHGAARYAETIEWNEQVEEVEEIDPLLKLRATHSYGIRYLDKDGKKFVNFLVKKGDELPATGTMTSHTQFVNQFAVSYSVYESDSTTTREYDEVAWGTQRMYAELNRTSDYIPAGTEAVDTLTLSQDGMLSLKVVDKMEGKVVENEVDLNREL